MAMAAREDSSTTMTLFDRLSEQPNGIPVASDPAGLELRENLSHSLEIENLLQIFFDHLDVRFTGFHYRNAIIGVDYHCGVEGNNRAEYRVVLMGEQLGDITVHREAPFTFSELAAIEERLCALVYPLRNAILYRSALKSAFRDPLTGVDNRAALENRLPREIQLAHRHGTPAALMVLDVDRFKEINDEYGHHHGDRVLQRLVAVFQSVLRTTDDICRYGGDEFVVVMSNTSAEGAMHVAERIRDRVERCRIQVGSTRLVLSTSIGVTEVHPDDDARTFFQRADEALLRAKRSGRNSVVLG